jgi:hypothetical protein
MCTGDDERNHTGPKALEKQPGGLPALVDAKG